MAAVLSSSLALSIPHLGTNRISFSAAIYTQSSGRSKQDFTTEIHGLLPKASLSRRISRLRVKAAEDNKPPTRKSVICTDCDGNGAVQCSQCKGNGVNSVDFFNGQFKTGESCWLCGGKKDMLCGNCNGAGFVGGFMSTGDQ